jgi:hypothetical protein
MSASDISLFVNFYNASASVTGCDNTNATTVGSVTPLTNLLTGLPSGLQLRIVNAAPTKTSGTGTTESQHGVDLRIWNASFVYTAGTTGKLYIEETSAGSSIWNIGDELTIDFGALNTNASRHLTLSSESGGSATYTNISRAASDDCPAPASFETNVQDLGDGRAGVIISPSGISVNSQLNFLRLYAAPRINSFNDGTVKIGEACTFAVKYFVPTAGNIGGSSLTSVTDTTCTAPDFIDGAICPAYGLNSVHLQSADNTKSADYSIYVLPPIGYAKTDIRDISKNSDGYLKKDIPGLALDDQVTFKLPGYFDPPIAVNTIDIDGAIRTDFVGAQIIKVRSISTGIVEFYNVITDGISPPVVVKIRTISASRIKGSFLKGNYLKGSVL